MVKHVIFDFDGTLVDSMHLVLEIGNALAREQGMKPITYEDFKQLGALPIKDRCRKLGIPVYRLPGYMVKVMNLYRAKTEALKMFDGMKELVTGLGEEYSLSILTSNSEANVNKFLTQNGMNGFKHIVSSKGLFGKHAAIGSFLRKQGISREVAVYVGDELRDIVACRKAGIRVIAVAWGYDNYELLAGGRPDFIVSQPKEISRVIKDL